MHFLSLTTALAAVPLVLGASSAPAQLRLSPSPATTGSRVTLAAPEANAVLAHHLGVSSYEHMPLSNNHDWQQALGDSDSSTVGQKIVVVLECPRQGCDDFIPSQLAESTPFDLPSLPTHSWTAAIALHAHRLADSLGLPRDSPVIVGLDSFVNGLKAIDGWAGWVGDELGSRIGWDGIKKTVKAAVVEPVRHSLGGIFTDVNLLQHESTSTLITEMESLSTLADSMASSSSAADDQAQSGAPQIVTLHIKGMKAIADALGTSSDTYKRAAVLLRASLDATLSALERAAPTDAAGDESSTVVLLTLPPYQQPLLRKRAKWLKPFESRSQRYASHVRPRSAHAGASAHAKRSTVFSPGKRAPADAAAEDRRKKQPIVPVSRRCFESLDQLNNLTASCLGHGVGVKGITTQKLKDGAECWVCSCGRAKDDNGKERTWGGQGCEKVDLSGDFVLLFFSGLGLIVVAVVSVMFLYGVGSQELPSVLSSVNGQGAGSKRD